MSSSPTTGEGNRSSTTQVMGEGGNLWWEFGRTFWRLTKEKLTDPAPPKGQSWQEKGRVLIEWIDRLGPWIPLQTIQVD